MAKRKKIKYKSCECTKGKHAKPGVCKYCHGSGQLRIIHSRNKGNSCERRVAQLVSKWSGFLCTRTPMSGGYAKTGDITPKMPEDQLKFPFCVEVKNREGWSLDELLTGKNSSTGLESWWRQVVGDSSKSKKVPILLFTSNLKPMFAMMSFREFKSIRGAFQKKPVTLRLPNSSRVIFLFSDLLRRTEFGDVSSRLFRTLKQR